MEKSSGDLQDGLLAHYLSQAAASDSNVEPRLDREPFDYREMLRRKALRQANPDVEWVTWTTWPPKP
jgi:hypothetical protein